MSREAGRDTWEVASAGHRRVSFTVTEIKLQMPAVYKFNSKIKKK